MSTSEDIAFVVRGTTLCDANGREDRVFTVMIQFNKSMNNEKPKRFKFEC